MAEIVFMGTPAFAVPSLRAVLEAGHRVKAVVTQPDKPAGRGQKFQPPPVKVFAEERGIPVLQPGRLRREPESVEKLRALQPEAIVVVAFGQILPQEVLDIPPKGCINVHGSLLPAYRGAGPIQWALINGETETGVTTMLMDAGMDTGPMFLKARMQVEPGDDAGTLGARMAEIGAKLLVETLEDWFAGRLEPVPQPAEGVTMAPMLKKEDGLLDFTQSAVRLNDRVRGVTPSPGAYTMLGGEVLKIRKTAVAAGDAGTGAGAEAVGPGPGAGKPGEILEVTRDGWVVATGEGRLVLQVVQLPGRKAQDAAEAARGLRGFGPGNVLGGVPAVAQ